MRSSLSVGIVSIDECLEMLILDDVFNGVQWIIQHLLYSDFANLLVICITSVWFVLLENPKIIHDVMIG